VKPALAVAASVIVEQDEIRRLKRENERLRMERDILKKTIADQLSACCHRNGCRYDQPWRGAAGDFLVDLVPVKKHGPWVVADLRVVTPYGDPG
jgi:hypothetical protein